MASPSPAKQLPLVRPAQSGAGDAKIRFLLILLTLVAMCPLLVGEFTTWDDFRAIERNAWLNPPSFAHLAQFWNPAHAFMDIWIPLTYTLWSAVAAVSYIPAADPQTGSHLNSWIFHGANLLVHLASVLVVYAILKRLIASKWAAAAGAALFAVHPVQVEPVGWLAGMKDLLSGCLSLIAIWQYLLYTNAGAKGFAPRAVFERASAPSKARIGAGDPPQALDDEGPIANKNARRLHYALATAAFALSMLAKPSGIVTPLIVAAFDWLLLSRPIRRVLLSVLPWLLLTIPIIAIARKVQAPTDLAVPLLQRPLIAGDALAFYLCKLVWPLHLGIVYDRTPQKVLSEHFTHYTWIAPVAIAVAMLLLRRRLPWLIAAGAVFCAALLPVLGFAPFDFQKFSTVADHYLYLALLGPALAAAIALRNVRHRAVWLAAWMVLLCFCARAFLQTFTWHDSLSLYRNAVAVSPRSCVCYNNLGETYRLAGNMEQALGTFETGLHYNPDCLDVRVTYANALMSDRRFDQAERQYHIALQSADPRTASYIEQNLKNLNAARKLQRR
ncbi:MAG TPA: tetratricopeptide repeat protein [Tepidisphaeraceae bacterium]|nr:tetratricopeptide repeat protein [Tepidisphaeraceae bacterium]